MDTRTEPVMFPCFMPAPNNLAAGDIVVHVDSGDRGLVLGNPSSMFGDVAIKLNDVASAVTNNSAALWLRVPYDDWTVEERVRSVALKFSGEADASLEDDGVAWDLLRSMLDDHEFEDLQPDCGWPDTSDLARAVARKIDRLKNRAANTVVPIEPPTDVA